MISPRESQVQDFITIQESLCHLPVCTTADFKVARMEERGAEDSILFCGRGVCE